MHVYDVICFNKLFVKRTKGQKERAPGTYYYVNNDYVMLKVYKGYIRFGAELAENIKSSKRQKS